MRQATLMEGFHTNFDEYWKCLNSLIYYLWKFSLALKMCIEIKLLNTRFMVTCQVSNVLKKCHNVRGINYVFCKFNQPWVLRCLCCTDYFCRKSAVVQHLVVKVFRG